MDNLSFSTQSPSIRPVSDLSKYDDVLNDAKKNGRVCLTQNGQTKYILIDAEDYEFRQKVLAYEELVRELNAAALDVEINGGYTHEEVWKELGFE